MLRSSSGADDGEMLVRLDTSLLQSRFDALAQKWDVDLGIIRNQVDACTSEVRSIAGDVIAMQHFLASYHTKEMLSTLSAHATEVSGNGTKATTEGILDRFVAHAMDGNPTENLLGMVAVARRLLTENETLRALLDSTTTALSTHGTGNDSMRQDIDQLQLQVTQQARYLQNINSSLGLLGLSCDVGNNKGGEDGTSMPISSFTTSSPEGHLSEGFLSHSPLLLSLRQILLRDLTERLTSAVDQQSKDFHDTLAHFEARLNGDQKGGVGSLGTQRLGCEEELQETIQAFSKKLKILQEQALRRDEFASLMKTKADALLLPTKADNAALAELEMRLGERFVELEERCAFADAERSEFRTLLRSLIAAQGHLISSEILPSSAEVSGASAKVPPRTVERVTRLADLLPEVGNGHAAVVSVPPSRREAAPTASRGNSTPRQLYRLCGTSQGNGLHGIPPSSAGSIRSAYANTGSLPHADKSVVAIGMTPTQGTYAAFVSDQLTRRQVASLPPLPYERAQNLQ